MNSLLFFLVALRVDSADVGELGPLHAWFSRAAAVRAADKPPLAVLGATGSGMTSEGSSVCVIRGRGVAPVLVLTVGAAPWKAGRGREGIVSLGMPRGGRGPTCRRRGVGGERRGMVVWLGNRDRRDVRIACGMIVGLWGYYVGATQLYIYSARKRQPLCVSVHRTRLWNGRVKSGK